MVRKRAVQFLLALGLLPTFAACTDAETRRIEETRAKLVGTWLEESESGVVKSRRVMTLEADGKLVGQRLVTTGGAETEKLEYAGEWSYDGANLKRRFLSENGRQFSGGKIRYATFTLVSVSSSELVIDDSIRGAKVALRRVPGGSRQ